MAKPGGEMKGGSDERFKPRSKRIRDHRDLRVWRKARKLADLCLTAARSFPEAQNNLAGVLCRLANEIPDEIAAGQAQGQHAAYMDHLERAHIALRHLERRLIETHMVNCLPATVVDPLLARVAEIGRMLGKLMVSLEVSYAQRRRGALAR